MNFLRGLLFSLIFLLLSWSSLGLAQESCLSFYTRDTNSDFSIPAQKGWIGSHQYFWDQAKAFRAFSKKLTQFETIQGANIDDPKFQEILKKIILNPKLKLSDKDMKVLSQNRYHLWVAQSLLQLLSAGELGVRVLQRLSHYWSGQISPPLSPDKTFMSRAQRLLKATYNGPVRFLIPFLPLPKIKNPTDQIFESKFRDPNYIITELEKETLIQNNSLEAFRENEEFQRHRPTWSMFRRWISKAFVVGFAVNGALLGNWAVHLSKPDATVSSDQFLSKAEYRLLSNQVRVYNESVPFPHMAIEMDGKVYSYGQTHMSVSTSQEYLMMNKIKKIVTANLPKEPAGSFSFENVLRSTGLDSLPRSVQMVTLTLDPAQKDKLKRSLELADHSAYRNQTLVMDCATMVIRALSKSTDLPLPFFEHNPLPVDASPSLVMMYLGTLKSLQLKSNQGGPLVGDIKQIVIDRPEEKNLHLWRNLYINAIDARVFLSFLPFNAPNRAYLNTRYGSTNFQYLQPEVRQEIIKWQKDVMSEMTDVGSSSSFSNQYQVFFRKALALAEIPQKDRNADWLQSSGELVRVSSYFFDREIRTSTEQFESPDSSFAEIVKSGYRIEILKKMKIQIQTLATIGTKDNSELMLESPDVLLTKILSDATR